MKGGIYTKKRKKKKEKTRTDLLVSIVRCVGHVAARVERQKHR